MTSRRCAQALGLGKVFFYGDSYGTLFGQAYAVRYPGSPARPHPRLRLPGRRPLLPDAAAGRPARAAGRLPPRADLLRRPGRALSPRRPPLPRRRDRSTDDLLDFLLQAGTLAPRSYLSLDEADRRFLAGDPRRLNSLIAPGPAGHGALREFSYGLEIAVECNDYPLLWDPYAPIDERIRQLSAVGEAAARTDYFAPFGAPRVPALPGRPPDQLPDLAGAAARAAWSRRYRPAGAPRPASRP